MEPNAQQEPQGQLKLHTDQASIGDLELYLICAAMCLPTVRLCDCVLCEIPAEAAAGAERYDLQDTGQGCKG